MQSKKIVFVGIDGSGKSSFIKFLKEKLEKEGKSVETKFMGWRDLENPLLRPFVKRKKDLEGDDKIKRFRERSWLFYIAYYLEMFYRYNKIEKRKADFVLIDRFFYDEIVFSKGFKFNLLRKLAPKPDLCVILSANSKVLKKRGENFSEEKLRYFYSALDKVKRICNVVELDSSRSRESMWKELNKGL